MLPASSHSLIVLVERAEHEPSTQHEPSTELIVRPEQSSEAVQMSPFNELHVCS